MTNTHEQDLNELRELMDICRRGALEVYTETAQRMNEVHVGQEWAVKLRRVTQGQQRWNNKWKRPMWYYGTIMDMHIWSDF